MRSIVTKIYLEGDTMKLIVGLGNPGKEYENTRHNIGFMILDSFLGKVTWSSKFNGLYYKTNINGENYIFLKPQSYMNLSGGVVKKYVEYFDIQLEDILIIQDDLDLEVGRIRLKIDSSAGGHNGIKDIILHLHSESFARLKIGISKKAYMDTKDYVLGHFSKAELEVIYKNRESIETIIREFSVSNLRDLMNRFN